MHPCCSRETPWVQPAGKDSRCLCWPIGDGWRSGDCRTTIQVAPQPCAMSLCHYQLRDRRRVDYVYTVILRPRGAQCTALPCAAKGTAKVSISPQNTGVQVSPHQKQVNRQFCLATGAGSPWWQRGGAFARSPVAEFSLPGMGRSVNPRGDQLTEVGLTVGTLVSSDKHDEPRDRCSISR
jgi:hypothetical protein